MDLRDYYTHFTSPIRRYPDLSFIEWFGTMGSKEVAEHFEQVIPEIATRSPTVNVVPSRRERGVEAMKKAEYMEEYAGEEYDAVAQHRQIRSLCRIAEHSWRLDSHQSTWILSFQRAWFDLRGEKSGITFRVGQQIRIRVERADKMTGEIATFLYPKWVDVIEKVSLKQAGRKTEVVVQVVSPDKKEDKIRGARMISNATTKR